MNSRLVKLLTEAGAVAQREGDKTLRVRHALVVLRRLRGSPVRAALAMAPGLGDDCDWPLQVALDNLACWSEIPFSIDAPHLLAAIAMVFDGPEWHRILDASIGIISRSSLLAPAPATRLVTPDELRSLALDVEWRRKRVRESSGTFTVETV